MFRPSVVRQRPAGRTRSRAKSRVRRAFVGAVATAVVGALPASAGAVELHVSPGGAASGTCSAESPCSLQYAVEQAAGGDEVLVEPGDYTANAPLYIGKAITVRGMAGKPRPRILGDGSGSVSIPVSGGTYTVEGTTVYVAHPGAKLGRLGIHQTGYNKRALFIGTGTAEDISAVTTKGMSTAVVITGGVLRSAIAYAGGSQGIAVDAALTNEIRNVTAIAPYAGGTALAVFGGQYSPADVRVRNTILRGAAFDIALGDSNSGSGGAKLDVDYSNYRPGAYYFGGGPATLTAGSHNQQSDPVFVNSAAGDYHQAATSPTIDAGIADGATGANDIDGEARLTGSAPDIGADERAAETKTQPDPGTEPPAQTGNQPPPDRDADGVSDAQDRCPTQRATTADGCPPAEKPPNQIVAATAGNDSLLGDALPNAICGLAGNDAIDGAGGDDVLWGDACNNKGKLISGAQTTGDGDDRLLGSAGNDSLYGAGGADTLDGGVGNDRLFGGSRKDRLVGGEGNDFLDGGSGKDSLDGGAGNDKLSGGTDADKIFGGAGTDVVSARDGDRDTVDCGAGKKDTASVDRFDKVKGCEKVKRAKK